MVERRPVNKTCSSLRKLKDELFGISVKATSKDMLIPREPRHYVWGTVETRYRRSVRLNSRIRYSPPHIESYGSCVRRWFQVRVLAAEPNRMIRVLRRGAKPRGGQIGKNFPRLFGFKANRLRAQNVVRANSFEKIPSRDGIF